jgi:glycosyltransferase involved in cell wall biosynthesis
MLYIYRFKDAWSNTTFKWNQSIQDHLELGRINHSAEFDAFNKKRLAEEEVKKASEPEKPATEYTLKDVSFVVLEGSPTPLTRKCIESVRKWAPGSEIVLVENGVPPSDCVKLVDKVVHLEDNIRFSGGCNAGADAATRPVVCFLSNDTEIIDDTPAKLLKGMNGKCIVGPYSNYAKPPQGNHDKALPQDIGLEMVVGLCMMMPMELFRAVGGFDTRLYTYEDDDICHRALAVGRISMVVGGTWVSHVGHATIKDRGENIHKVDEENRKIFDKKYPKIRVVAIAKDEEKGIQGFFEQFAPVTKDWCLLDTGSTDKTVEIAKSMGVKTQIGIFQDFATTRNEAIRLFGDAEWVIMMDPDERMDKNTIQSMRELVFRTEYNIFLSPLQAVNRDGSKTPFVPKPYLFRNLPEIKWVLPVHEKLIGSMKQAKTANGMISHMIALHDQKRRQDAAKQYQNLGENKNYYDTPEYRKVREEWPILDYERADDDRIAKVHLGPLVSVVIPTYRRPDLLRMAVVSALIQDYVNLEVVIVGDACPDLGKGFNPAPRIRAFNLPKNHGAGGAVPRNFAIHMAAGQYIAYLDDDNTWKPNHVSSIMTKIMAMENLMVPGVNVGFGFSSMEVNGKDLKFKEPKIQGIDTSCIIHRKDLIRKYGPWRDRTAATYAHDWELVERWLKGGEKWICTESATLLYNAGTSGQQVFLEGMK